MKKLHQLLAFRVGPTGTDTLFAKNMAAFHQYVNSGKPYEGMIKEHTILDEAQAALQEPTETIPVKATAMDDLIGVIQAFRNASNTTASIESTNTIAAADIVLGDGTVITKQVPSIVLMPLQKQLESLLKVFENAPTLDATKQWESMEEYDVNGVYRTSTVERRNQTSTNSKTIVIQGTMSEHHPAQTEKVVNTVIIGHKDTTYLSGALTMKDKKAFIDKTNALLIAVKSAIYEANNADVIETNIGDSIVDFLLS